jgi:purine-nucleoside phosphorylase
MTPHIEAKENEIAKIVIMPGDPLRAKFIVETYLEDYKLVNDVRGMYAYTGKYKGKEITVMASGMGMPSIGIYSYELFKFYNVEKIIRIGSCGSYTADLDLYDMILVNASYTESSYAKAQNGSEDNMIYASDYLNFYLKETAEELNEHVTIANVHSCDVFYKENNNFKEFYNKCVYDEYEQEARAKELARKYNYHPN